MAMIKGTDGAIDYLIGTAGGDVISGMGKGDYLYGFGGNDVLKGGGGADTLFGGSGKDFADYSDSNVGVQVSIAAGGGSLGTAEGDKLYDIENLSGSQHDDILEGDDSANTLYGDAGNDVLKGGGGSDRLDGGAGNDQLNSDGLGDRLDGGTGIDTAYFQGAKVAVHVNLEMGLFSAGYYPPKPQQGGYQNIFDIEHVKGTNLGDTIVGSSANNNLYGYNGDDRLFGGAGKDALNGGEGNDTINGGAGNDSLIGGAGDDTFVFTNGAAGVADIGKDTVKGFSPGHDKIQLDVDVFSNFAELAANMQQVGASAVIEIDPNNTITVLNVNVASLSASDFLFS